MTTLSQLSKDLIGVLLLVLLVIVFLCRYKYARFSYPSISIKCKLHFLSIVLEAIPFILIGVFASALIQVFVSEEFIQRLIPKIRI